MHSLSPFSRVLSKQRRPIPQSGMITSPGSSQQDTSAASIKPLSMEVKRWMWRLDFFHDFLTVFYALANYHFRRCEYLHPAPGREAEGAERHHCGGIDEGRVLSSVRKQRKNAPNSTTPTPKSQGARAIASSCQKSKNIGRADPHRLGHRQCDSLSSVFPVIA